jgi:hypothetical protein
MPTLPNILPAANSASLCEDEMTKLSAAPDKGVESFDHLMVRALSPSAPKIKVANVPDADNDTVENIFAGAEKSKEAPASTTLNAASVMKNSAAVEPNVKTDAGSFLVQPENSKSSPQTLETGHGKKTSDRSGASTNSSAPTASKSAAVNPEIVSVQIPAPVVALEAANAKTATDVSMTEAAIAVAGNVAGIAMILPGMKSVSLSATKNSSPKVPQIQSDTAAISKTKTDVAEKTSPPSGALLVAKTSMADSKISGLKPVTQPVSPLINSGPENPKVSILATKPADDLPAPEISSLPAADAKISAPPPVVDDGTPAAQQVAPMNNGEKANKTSDVAGKFLPGSVAVTARGNVFSAGADQNSAAVAVGSSAQASSSTATQLAAEPVGNLAADDLRSQALERTHDLVVLHALRLSDVGNGSLQVVIKPDAGTQLSLELRQRDGGIEAQANLQQGDFAHLNQRWPELQQQLEQRGIKLGALTGENNFDGGNGFFQAGRNPTAEADAFSGGTLVVPAAINELAAQTSAHRGWETWA